MFERIRAFFRDNPRMWLVVSAAVLAAVIVVWGVYGGFSLQISRFFAAYVQEPSGGSGGATGGGGTTSAVNPSASTQSCGSLGGTVCTGRDTGGCSSGYTDVGQKTTDCDSGYGYCCAPTSGGSTPAPAAGGAACGTSVVQGGQFDWGIRTSEPWGDCADGKAPTYWVDVNVGACHPNGLHLVWRAEHRNQASCNIGLAGDGIAEGSGITTAVTGFSNMDLPNGQAGTAQMTYDPKTFACGSVRLWGAFWAAGPESQAKNAGYTGYYKVINYGTDCGGTSGSGPSVPAATPTPGPTEPVTCAPASQTVSVGQIAQLTAAGGNGTFQWDVSGGGVVQQGGNQAISISYSTSGTKTVRVNSGTATATCTVSVAGAATGTPSPESVGFTLTKTGRNLTTGEATAGTAVSASTNQTVQFTLAITNGTGAAVTNLLLTDEVPGGMTYYPGSLIVEGQSIGNNAITTSGLQLGRLEAGDTVTVQWSALANRTGLLPAGAQTSRPRASATTAEGVTAQALMDVVVIGTGTGTTTTTTGTGGTATTTTGVGGVSTGPGGVTLIALIVSALVAFLYAGYTRSDGFRRRELEQLGRGHDPLDFRS